MIGYPCCQDGAILTAQDFPLPELGQYSVILTSCLVNNPHLLFSILFVPACNPLGIVLYFHLIRPVDCVRGFLRETLVELTSNIEEE